MSVVNRETDYAIRILRSLHDQETKSVAHICEDQSIAISFAHKIVKKLEHGGFLNILRGPGGGVRLACDLSTRNMYELMETMDNVQYANDCFKKGYNCELQCSDKCTAHSVLMKLQQDMDNELKSIPISSLM